MSDMNRPYTLAELRELPEGTEIWIDEHPQSEYNSAYSSAGDLEDMDEYGRTWRAWPAPPSAEEMAAWPWEGLNDL